MTRNIWFWSDQHVGHANIISFMRKDGVTRLRPEFYQRCWDGDGNEVMGRRLTDAMANRMVERYNFVVKPQDEVWFGGDVGFNQREYNTFMQRLVPCAERHLLLGNHDRLPMKDYLKHFDSVRVEKTFRDEGFIFSHYPVHQSCLGSHLGRKGAAPVLNVHGHTHANEVMMFENGNPMNRPDPRYVNVCVEHTDYGLVHIDELAARARRV